MYVLILLFTLSGSVDYLCSYLVSAYRRESEMEYIHMYLHHRYLCMYGSMYVSSSADDARRFDSSVGMAASRKGCWSWLRDGQLRVM